MMNEQLKTPLGAMGSAGEFARGPLAFNYILNDTSLTRCMTESMNMKKSTAWEKAALN